MTIKEFHQYLKDNKIKIVDVAEKAGVKPTDLTNYFRRNYCKIAIFEKLLDVVGLKNITIKQDDELVLKSDIKDIINEALDKVVENYKQ